MTEFHERRRDSRFSDSHSDASPGARRLLQTKIGPVLILVAIMWAVRLADTIIPVDFNQYGLRSWDWDSIWGIFTAPFLHSGWGHLIGNSLAMFILGGLVAMSGKKMFAWVTMCAAVVAGLGVFFVNSPGSLTVGASGLVFGYFGYLVVAGFFERTLPGKLIKLGLAFVVLSIWGIPMLVGLLPIRMGVSWQGHLFGLIGGVLAAFIAHRHNLRKQRHAS